MHDNLSKLYCERNVNVYTLAKLCYCRGQCSAAIPLAASNLATDSQSERAIFAGEISLELNIAQLAEKLKIKLVKIQLSERSMTTRAFGDGGSDEFTVARSKETNKAKKHLAEPQM